MANPASDLSKRPASMLPAWRRLLRPFTGLHIGSRFVIVLTTVAAIAGIATYLALTTDQPIGSDPQMVVWLLNIDILLLVLLGIIVGRRVLSIWILRRRGLAGSRLHLRLMGLFGMVAVLPAAVMVTFSLSFFHFGVQSWFSDRVSMAVDESLAVARAYLNEHQQSIEADALAMANDLDREAARIFNREIRISQVVRTQALLRNLTEAMVIQGNGRVLARSGFTFALELDPVDEEMLEIAREGDVAMDVDETDDRVRALVQLDNFVDTYLLVGRLVEPRVLEHMQNAQSAVEEYTSLEGRLSGLRVSVTLVFIMVALLLLLVSIWIALNVADTLARPIGALIGAAEQIRAGDLSVRVGTVTSTDELGTLSRAFDRMTGQLEQQRGELIDANRQNDDRRRFTEAVLSGVSAGVIGLDENGRVELVNRAAADFLGYALSDSFDRTLDDLFPTTIPLLEAVRRRPGRLVQHQLDHRMADGTVRRLLTRISAEMTDGAIRGYVVTFDDVTELLAAQRKAAWSDIARRIAHEIKNPLTPIQLAAERLRRRYGKEIQNDPQIFDQCIDTIIRQVDDIGRLVNEFSAFARMPSPKLEPMDLNALCQRAAVLMAEAHPDIDFDRQLPLEPVIVTGDSGQLNQVLTNLIQNSVDAIHGSSKQTIDGTITIVVDVDVEEVHLRILDNGPGMPRENRDRLTEPYVTTRAKGTGLGLAIVKTIVEDHNGMLSLDDRPGGGAAVTVTIPRSESSTTAQPSVSSMDTR